MKPAPKHRTVLYAALGITVIAILILAVVIPLAIRGAGTAGTQPTPTPTHPTATTTTPVTPTPTSSDTNPSTPSGTGVKMGPQACPATAANLARWNTIIGTKSGVNMVESVSCASIVGNTSLQALVTVRYSNSTHTMDAYIYNNITSSQPTLLFKLQGLRHGDAKISGYNTVMTAEADELSIINKGKAESAMTQDLFREFDWSDGAGTLVQVAFPGIFPDLTRYQAEADQARVSQGQDTWKNNAASVARSLASKFFQWKGTLTTKVLSGGGAKDVNAVVYVEEAPQAGGQSTGPNITVTLSRLEGNTHNMWVAIGVSDGKLLTLTNLTARSVITSPITVKGVGAAFEALIGKAIVYDHWYTDIGHQTVYGQGMGTGPYATIIDYDTSFHRGLQEGIVSVQMNNGGISNEIYTSVMIKVLLTPEPGVTSGPKACPTTVNNPAYWNPYIKNYGPNTPVADKVICANIVGRPTIQAMVVAHEIVGGGPLFRAVFVFDNISSQQPTLIFKLQHMMHGDAKISIYNTVMTSEVDINSPLNKGKADSAMQNDLFREFKWSDGAGILVQTTFPGLYPDLTRWQAEDDQIQVNQGHQPWKLDAAMTAQSMAAGMLHWSPNSQTKLMSGGGPQDVSAVVDVTNTNVTHAMITVTLSRLEGNTHNIWIVIGVSSKNYSITWPPKGALLTSPTTVKGSGPAFEATIGTLYVLDHRYAIIGQAVANSDQNIGMGITTFTTPVSYTATFHGGAQEGVLALYSYSPADNTITGVCMQKVMIQA